MVSDSGNVKTMPGQSVAGTQTLAPEQPYAVPPPHRAVPNWAVSNVRRVDAGA
jgi:hypothetical protein